MLAEGALDASPVSSVAAAEQADEWLVVDNLCIGCRGDVGSVILHSDRPIEGLAGSSIAVTGASATAAKLLETLLARHWKINARLAPQHSPAHARLLIGDAALKTAQSNPDGYVYDLGGVWRDFTGEDFVFGLWCVRKSYAEQYPDQARALYHLLKASYALGRLQGAGVVSEAAELTGLSKETLRAYFGKLVYELDDRLWAGLSHFLRMLGYAPEKLQRFGGCA
jgi:chorismate dehydratase